MEGPSIVILKEEVKSFKGKTIIEVSGNSKIDQKRLLNQKIIAFKSWGKHFLVEFRTFSLRIHFLMFGSYRINETKESTPRLHLKFKNGELNMYTCSIKLIEEPLSDVYDWEVDVMADEWNAKKAVSSLRNLKNTMICDALLNQQIFAGSGNIIKNEVLFRVKIHPERLVETLTSRELRLLADEVRVYSFDFYRWKKVYQLKKHWLVYNKKSCPECGNALVKKYTGSGKRRSFFCSHCQN